MSAADEAVLTERSFDFAVGAVEDEGFGIEATEVPFRPWRSCQARRGGDRSRVDRRHRQSRVGVDLVPTSRETRNRFECRPDVQKEVLHVEMLVIEIVEAAESEEISNDQDHASQRLRLHMSIDHSTLGRDRL